MAVTRLLKPDFDQVIAGVGIAGQRQQPPIPVFGVSGESDAVVGGVGLLGEYGHPPFTGTVARAQCLDESVTDHAVADDHDVP